MDTKFQREWILKRIRECEDQRVINFVYWFLLRLLTKPTATNSELK